MKTTKRALFQYIVVGLWVSFTLGLATWLYIFSARQTEKLGQIDSTAAQELIRYHRMLLLEGSALFLCLLGGGIALAYSIFRDSRRVKRMQQFFTTFTHELKTPLASLQLQTESLKEDLGGTEHAGVLARLASDANRLSLQLENSLFIAESDQQKLFPEKIPLRELVRQVSHMWPDIAVTINKDAILHGDRRACQSILSNIFQNAAVHGEASEIRFETSQAGSLLMLEVRDNGKGFQGDCSKLGELFNRQYSGSGNGIGLYTIKKLSTLMGGSADFIPQKNGFMVKLSLPGEVQ